MQKLYPDIYEDTLFVAREMNLMAAMVTNYSASGWMDRHIGIYPQMTARTIDEDQDFVNPTQWTKSTAVTLTPGEIVTGVELTDRRITTDPEDARRSSSSEMGAAIAYKVDTDILGNFSSFASTVGYAGSALGIERCAAAMSELRAVPVNNPLSYVLHPFAWHDVWVELGKPEANFAFLGDIANEAMRGFYVGSWMNATWFTSANIARGTITDSVRGTAGTAGYNGLFHRESLALDVRRAPRLEADRDITKRAWELVMTMGYAHGVRRDNWGCALVAELSSPNTV
jgi:hypothetical protein